MLIPNFKFLRICLFDGAWKSGLKTIPIYFKASPHFEFNFLTSIHSYPGQGGQLLVLAQCGCQTARTLDHWPAVQNQSFGHRPSQPTLGPWPLLATHPQPFPGGARQLGPSLLSLLVPGAREEHSASHHVSSVHILASLFFFYCVPFLRL